MTICKVKLSSFSPPTSLRPPITDFSLAKVLDVRCTLRHFRLRSPGWRSRRPASKLYSKSLHLLRDLTQNHRWLDCAHEKWPLDDRLCMLASMPLLTVAWKHFVRRIRRLFVKLRVCHSLEDDAMAKCLLILNSSCTSFSPRPGFASPSSSCCYSRSR